MAHPTARPAATALLTGVVVWVVGAYLLEWPYPFLTSLAASALAYALVMGVSLLIPAREI